MRFVLWCSGSSHRFAARFGDALFVSFVVMVQEQANFVVAKSAGGGAPVDIRLVTCSHCGRSHQRDGETAHQRTGRLVAVRFTWGGSTRSRP